MPRRRLTLEECKELITSGGLDDKGLRRFVRDPRVGVRELARRELRRRAGAVAELERLETLLAFERPLWSSGLQHIAGTDEVGAGPLAGPVVAAAVILPPGTSIARIDDSKKLDHETRVELAAEIRARAVSWALGSCSVEEIDTLNILRASCEAMCRAVRGLACVPQHVLIDARRLTALALPQTPIIDGDAKSQSIAAASILAKVHRDGLMEELEQKHPGYGFAKHKGYATAEHRDAIKRLGLSPVHRRSFCTDPEAVDPQMTLAL